MVTLLWEGLLLIEDVPGIGKSMLAKALARSLGCKFRRLQCTPDLLPTDVTGLYYFNQQTQQFEFRPGPIFTSVLLADEINRATPRTQAALLECMEERQVTLETGTVPRSEEHTSELQSQSNLVCRLLLEKKKTHEKNSAARRENSPAT